MTQFLPTHLLNLFVAREPIPYLPPVDKLTHEKKCTYTGVSEFLKHFEDPKDTPPVIQQETKEERRERRKREKEELATYKLEQDLALWNPHKNPSATTDPYKTLFVARMNYEISESKLRKEFEEYGTIKKIVIVHDKSNGKPRGYAFIEYKHERDMRAAYKHADGKKIAGRRVLVDVERGRTVKGWLPRRLGGGLGSTRKGGSDVNTRHSGRDISNDHYRDYERDRHSRAERKRSRSHSRGRNVKRVKSRSRSREKHRPDRNRGHAYDREKISKWLDDTAKANNPY